MSVPGDSQVETSSRAGGQQEGLGIGSMICGIAAIPAAIVFAFLGIGLGVVAVVLGVVVRRNPGPTPRAATAGLVLGVIALVVGVVNSIFGALLLSGQL